MTIAPFNAAGIRARSIPRLFLPLEWVAWFNNNRLLEPIGSIPPVEFEEAYYRQQDAPAMVAGVN